MAETLMQSCPDSALMLLDCIDINSLSKGNERERYYVLLAQAQHKCDKSITDSIIPAARYFDDKSDHYLRMLSKYYAGMYLINLKTNRESEAIIYLNDAALLADSLRDHMYSGLANRGIAMVYQRIYDGQNEIKHFRKSLEDFKKDGSQPHIDYAKLDLAIGLMNSCRWAESIVLAREAFERGLVINDGCLASEGMKVLGRAFINCGKPDSLIFYFKIVEDKYPERIECDDYTFLSYAYYLLGDMAKANEFLALADTTSLNTEWYVSRMLARNGDYRDAYMHLLKQYDNESSIVRNIITQTVSTSISEHLSKQRIETQNRLLNTQNKFWLVVSILSSLIVVILCVTVYIINKKKKKLKTAQQNILALKTMLDKLKHDNNESTMHIREVLKSKISVIEGLLYSYYAWNDSSTKGHVSRRSREHMYKEAMRVISDCQNIHSDIYKGMEANVNSNYDDVIIRFKSSFPDLTDQDYMLFTFSAFGFSTPTLCLFLDVDSKSLYNRKYRLRSRIKDSSDINSNDFLTILS